MFSTLNPSGIFAAAASFAAKPTLRERYEALRQQTPAIALWFAPGESRYEAVGEIPGDTSVKVISTSLKGLEVLKLETRTLFVGWLQDDIFRTDLINGHEHRQKIRVVSASNRSPITQTCVFESDEWTSRNDDRRFGVEQLSGIGNAKMKLTGDGRLDGIKLIDSDGKILHSFGSVSRYNDTEVPFPGFDGIGGERSNQRLAHSPRL